MGGAYSRKYDPREPAFKLNLMEGMLQCGLPRCHEPSFDDMVSFTRTLTLDESPPHRPPGVEEMLKELFRLHDLNSNGLLEEEELVRLNIEVAKLHYGDSADLPEIHAKYSALFREKLDAEGNPIPYGVFRCYMLGVLNELDKDPRAQQMIAEQLAVEASVARIVLELPPDGSSDESVRLQRYAQVGVHQMKDTEPGPASLKQQRKRAACGGA